MTTKQSRAGKAHRSAPKRPRVRKPATVEIAGHELTCEQYIDYGRALERRQDINRDQPPGRIEQMALDDVLSPFRPTRTAEAQLTAIFSQLSTAALAVANLASYPFFDSRAPAVRLAGCDTLNRLAAEAQFLGAKIAAIGDAIRHEHREHLQDWQKRLAALEAASAYGAAPSVTP